MICFSTAEEDSQKDSYFNVKTEWVPEVRNASRKPIILVGTKTDLRDQFLKDKSECPQVLKIHSAKDVSFLKHNVLRPTEGRTQHKNWVLS